MDLLKHQLSESNSLILSLQNEQLNREKARQEEQKASFVNSFPTKLFDSNTFFKNPET